MAKQDRQAAAREKLWRRAPNPALGRAVRLLGHSWVGMLICVCMALLPGLARAACMAFDRQDLLRWSEVLLVVVLCALPQVMYTIFWKICRPGESGLLPPASHGVWMGLGLCVVVFAAVWLTLGYVELDTSFSVAGYDLATLGVFALAIVGAGWLLLPAIGGGVWQKRWLWQHWRAMFRRRGAALWCLAAACFALLFVLLCLGGVPLLYANLTGNRLDDLTGSVADVISLPLAVVFVYFAALVSVCAFEPPLSDEEFESYAD